MRLFVIGAAVMMLTGCVTTRKSSNMDQLQVRVVELEKKLEERDSEIVDLKYQIKDLSGRVQGQPILTVEEDTSSYRGSSESVEPASTSDEKVIKVSASASQVQRALKSAGFYKGSIDGKIGQQTKKAIENFQRSHNLTADGVVGRRTWEELKAYLQ